MFPLSIFTYVKAGIITLLILGCLYGYVEHNRFVDFKREVEYAAKAQEAHNESVKQQNELVNKGVKDAYEAKLAAVRNFYAGGVQYPSGSSMSGISAAPKGTDAETAYPILAGQCAETTAQLVSLQDWINQQVGIK